MLFVPPRLSTISELRWSVLLRSVAISPGGPGCPQLERCRRPATLQLVTLHAQKRHTRERCRFVGCSASEAVSSMRLSLRLQPLGLYGPAVRVRRGYGILELVRVLRFEPLAGWRSDQPGAARLTRSSAGSYPYVGHRMARVSGGRAAMRSTAREVFISGAAIPRRSMSVRLTATTSSCSSLLCHRLPQPCPSPVELVLELLNAHDSRLITVDCRFDIQMPRPPDPVPDTRPDRSRRARLRLHATTRGQD